VQSRWGSRFDFGRDTFLFSRHLLVDAGRLPYLPYYVALGTAVVALALLALSVRQGQPLPLLAYSAVLVAMALGGTGGGYYFQCKARFLLPAFPLLLPVAAAGAAMATARPRTAALAVVSMAGLSLAYGTYLVTAAHMAL
jgi:hypothetical protein